MFARVLKNSEAMKIMLAEKSQITYGEMRTSIFAPARRYPRRVFQWEFPYRTAQSQLSSIILALSGNQRVRRVVRGSLKREINNPINLLNIQRNVRRGLDMQAIEVVLMIAALAAVLSAIGAWIAARDAQHWAAKALQSEI